MPDQRVKVCPATRDTFRLAGIILELKKDRGLSITDSLRPEEYVKNVITSQPDVLLFDRTVLPPESAEALGECKKLRAGLRMLLVGTDEDDSQIVAAVRAGVDGYVNIVTCPALVGEAVRALSAGRLWIPRGVVAPLVDHARNGQKGDSASLLLCSPMERSVLSLLANEGLTNKEISSRLAIEERTVEAHVTNLLRRLGLSNRCQLVICAIQDHLVPFHPILARAGEQRRRA
jgi:DNA-binding NarL/FixJ family response regulator